ncbi:MULTISPECIES: ABC transporter substrate-binding protein [unclassified Acidovorax]|uniref:ABC transporter substrate-binding protein n=1 Tax=unclassified Acidovorax TaxID=2684926 RepID=UPI00070ACEC4|nr:MULTISPECIES: extracellular solute-binding protein [unclassified Acidovorax]KRC15966.1 ABC transporter substrate-binding protein [Acidovorax sp. Root219]KRC19283.1 ABC transporter substrate-binding protein [Acidovorax sp. Root217]
MFLRRREFGVMAASALAFPAIVRAQAPALAALHDAARKEGELTWYTVPQTSEVAEKMGRTFTARYPGIKVNVVRTTAQVAYQRLNQDLKAGTPNCDVFTSTDLAHYVDLKGRNLLLKFLPAAVARQDKRVQNMDPDGYFHASSCFMMGLVYNTQKVSAAAAPKSWADLLDPKWSGAALVAHPAYSGAAGAWCIEMRKLYGDDFFKKLAANKAHVSRSTIDAVTAVISGESSVSAGPMSLAARSAAKGNPVATLVPKEGPVLILSPTGILANTRRPNASKLFMEWMLGSEDTERISVEEFSVPLRAHAKPAPGVIGLGDANPLLAPTPPQMVAQIPKVIDAWREAFGV